MVGGTRIIAFEPGGQELPGEEFLLSDEVDASPAAPDWQDEPDEAPPVRRREWLWPSLAIVAVAAWTAFFVWANQGQLREAVAPAAWPGLIADWLTPVLVIGMMWLLFMRNSHREARRFGDSARMLSDESARLETRLTTVNRELSLAREFIAAQSRDLEALGRTAVDRISQNSDRLQALIHDNGARIDSIGNVSEAALDNMEKLRSQLPVIASSAKDVTNNIANAGRTAAAQLAEMVAGFDRLNTFGEASERQVQSLRARVDEALAEFARQCEKIEQIADTHFTTLTAQGSEFRGQLDTHEAEALESIRRRADALAAEVAQTRNALDAQEQESLTSLRSRLAALRDEGGAMSRSIRDGEARSLESWREAITRLDEDLRGVAASLETTEAEAVEGVRTRIAALGQEADRIDARLAERSQAFEAEALSRVAAFEASDGEALARLSEQLAALDGEIAARRAEQERQSAALMANGDAITRRLEEFERHLGEIAARGRDAEEGLSASVRTLAGKLTESTGLLTGADREIAALTDASVRLLEIIQASKQQTRDDLPEALAAGEQRLAAFEARAAALLATVAEAGLQGEAFAGVISASDAELRTALAEIGELQAAIDRNSASQADALAGLRDTLADVDERSETLARKAQGELTQAIETLLAAASEASTTIETTGAQAVSALAGRLGEESGAAIDKAMRTSASEAAGQIEQAAAHAAGVSREAAIQLRDQLAKVNDLVGNLERRVAHARQRAEEQVDNDFARRAALITESLNSNAIDIAKALATDVSDSAWSAYLRGDRGIFTRRAVSLIESGDAKSIVQVFEADSDFREHVSRYVHDFEAILRQVLSTRDGHALGVTLLSSDMGKLYVALAQAIERLRN